MRQPEIQFGIDLFPFPLLEREEDLERRYEMLQRELRIMMNVEDWEKTEAQKRREDLLLQELVQVTHFSFN